MPDESMTLEILLPQRVYATIAGVERIVAEGAGGSFGLLPHRLDCVAALVPGILTYATAAGESWLAIDQGLLVKTGLRVRVAVRAAQAGAGLADLREAVAGQFLAIDDNERAMRGAMQKLETGFVHALGGRHD
jgi:F-type H+-transporting ATPase subunit epsilon